VEQSGVGIPLNGARMHIQNVGRLPDGSWARSIGSAGSGENGFSALGRGLKNGVD